MPKWAPREALAALSVRLTRGVWYPFSGSAVPSRKRFPCPALSPGFSLCELHSTDKQTNKISLLLMAVVCFCNLWLLSFLIFYMSGSGKVKRCTEFTARLLVQSELLLQPCLLQLKWKGHSPFCRLLPPDWMVPHHGQKAISGHLLEPGPINLPGFFIQERTI